MRQTIPAGRVRLRQPAIEVTIASPNFSGGSRTNSSFELVVHELGDGLVGLHRHDVVAENVVNTLQPLLLTDIATCDRDLTLGIGRRVPAYTLTLVE
jgi:hypothetical protein